MTESTGYFGILLLIMGAVVILAAPIRAGLGRFGLPEMIGFILLGAALSGAQAVWGFMTPPLEQALELLAKIGIVALLFRVGLESDVQNLLHYLHRASVIWFPNMALAALAVFAVVLLWPGLSLLSAVFAAVAASATSIGVSVAVWDERGLMQSEEGALLLDVAELDDISAVVLLSVLTAVAPLTVANGAAGMGGEAALMALAVLAKIVLTGSVCFFFSRLLDKPLSRLFARIDSEIGPFLLSVGVVFLIAGLAESLGFSVAIGALFAGLAFSIDPKEREIDRAFDPFKAVFAPFFFFGIGLSLDPYGLGAPVIWLSAALTAAALLGKIVGAGLPAAIVSSRRTGWLIGVSMVPRAEIFLLVMHVGLNLGDWAVPQRLYSAAVLTSLATCIIGPVLVGISLRRHTERSGS